MPEPHPTDSAPSSAPQRASDPDQPRRRVLVTGAAGRIGSYFVRHTHEKYDLRLMVRPEDGDVEPLKMFGQVVVADLAQADRLHVLCQDVDTVLHLAANPNSRAPWDALIGNNIIGTYNVFAAAKAAGVRRVVYASSLHAMSGYPRDVQVKADDPVNPGNLYGVSKCFGEALARCMAEQGNLSAIAIRIGAYTNEEHARLPRSLRLMDAWVSPRDLQQLLELSIDAGDHVRFAIVHGLSDNAFKRADITHARALLGYQPQDDFARENPLLASLNLAEQAPL